MSFAEQLPAAAKNKRIHLPQDAESPSKRMPSGSSIKENSVRSPADGEGDGVTKSTTATDCRESRTSSVSIADSSSSSSRGKSSQSSSGIASGGNSNNAATTTRITTAPTRTDSSSNYNYLNGEMTTNRPGQKSMHVAIAADSSIDDKVARYKAENKKLRKELMLLRIKREVEQGQDQEEHIQSSLLVKENADLRRNVSDLQEQCKQLSLQLQQHMDTDKGNERKEELSGLQKNLLESKSELAEVTQLKNSEIEVLRKQLNRAEEQLLSNGQQDDEMKNIERVKSWNDERGGFREEIRRLNLEVSTLKGGSRKEDDDESVFTTVYLSTINGSSNDTANKSSDLVNIKGSSSDVESLQSIITMMRQVIDQSHHERDVLEQRLAEEIERSQMELQAFAKTLEGVDDLRKSAESMSREIRRIKVKGYRPTRSDLLMTMGGGGGGAQAGILESGGARVRNFGELTAAVEASESMESAIRLIESQNDSMEERRRAAVVVGAASLAAANATGTTPAKAPISDTAISTRTRLSPIRDDEEEGGGFLSFWSSRRDAVDIKDDDDEAKKKKKRSKRHSKMRGEGGGSVLTSFF